MRLQMCMHEFIVVQFGNRNILMQQVMAHPHGVDQPYITDAIDRKNFHSILYREIAIAVNAMSRKEEMPNISHPMKSVSRLPEKIVRLYPT